MSTERKVAVITGASQGIGAGLVQGFLGRGFRVVANSRSIEPAASADVLTVAGDITDSAVANRVIAGAVEKFCLVNTLVNNAGISANPQDRLTPIGLALPHFFAKLQKIEHLCKASLPTRY